MELITTISSLRNALAIPRREGNSISLAPTMGNLHAGHIALIAKARQLADVAVVSIFVNPTQFDRAEDLARYPRTLEADLEQLRAVGVDFVFAPEVQEMYPNAPEPASSVEVPGITERLEGQKRPGHFNGVATVVTKLFNIVGPDFAVFGEKDYQQLQVIRQLAGDLNLPVEILSQPTVREADGLALSSRNGLLSASERAKAPLLHQILSEIAHEIRDNATDLRGLEHAAAQALTEQGFRPEYVGICNPDSLLPAQTWGGHCVILAAAWLGNVRLIDNLIVDAGP